MDRVRVLRPYTGPVVQNGNANELAGCAGVPDAKNAGRGSSPDLAAIEASAPSLLSWLNKSGEETI